MRSCVNSETRRKMHVARRRRAGRNVGVLEDILVLRARQAKLLGYAHPADFETEVRMSGSAEAVESFYAELRGKLRVKAELDFAEYQRAKRTHLGEPSAQLNVWDRSFYHDLLLKEKYRVDQQEVKQYFSMGHVIDGLFSITQELYGLEYREITGGAAAAGRDMWHEDVRLFEVWDKDQGELLGEFYIDLHPRPNKYNHAAQFGLQARRRFADGSLQRPIVALVCNLSKPTAEAPALLQHSEVVTFFHEFGHCLHSLLTESELARFSRDAGRA